MTLAIIIPAAGFGTRLNGVETKPKGLIGNGKNTIMGMMIANLMASMDKITSDQNPLVLVTNNQFYPSYQDWFRHEFPDLSIQIVNNSVDRPPDRSGAIGDLLLG